MGMEVRRQLGHTGHELVKMQQRWADIVKSVCEVPW